VSEALREARRIRVTGLVQGVGFRPHVWRLARETGVAGWVRNDAGGVEIAAEGSVEQLGRLAERLRREAPPLARVDAVTVCAAEPEGHDAFVIAESAGGPVRTTIGHDTAVCPECRAEMLDPAGRRWRHAFITCTHCGPRYTVTRSLPYDRPQTSLAPFPFCSDCEREYQDPADRRFHAETTCCPVCGPRLQLLDPGGGAMASDPVAEALALLRAGAIVAIKGLGGYHLACDAANGRAVARLRERKQREEKPFAVMVANGASIAPYALAGSDELALLTARESPVVLLKKRPGCDLRLPGIAPGIGWLGVMLPYTPLQLLLFHEAAGRPAGTGWLAEAQPLALVMTSANPGGEPIVRDDAEALQRLAGIADAFLTHDRAIVGRCDDSVARAGAGGVPRFIRRARGWMPRPIRLPRPGPAVLALGGYLKNTVCLTRGDQAFLSAHVGDLDNAATCAFLEESVVRLTDLLEIEPAVVTCDRHPDFHSSRLAARLAAERGLPLVAVQHHQAHIAAVAAEHGIDCPLLGLALDGVGLGDDGGIWGGELLRLDGARHERLGHLRPLALPGGDRAAREPWRMAAAALHALNRQAEIGRCFPGAAGEGPGGGRFPRYPGRGAGTMDRRRGRDHGYRHGGPGRRLLPQQRLVDGPAGPAGSGGTDGAGSGPGAPQRWRPEPRPGLDCNANGVLNMCLAIPARVVELLGDDKATVDLGGVRKDISLALVDDVDIGDYVILHVGYALNKLDPEEAERTLALFAEMGAAAT